MTFADKVKYVRMKLYLSQAQLAKEIGVSFATVNRWESKGYEPQLASLAGDVEKLLADSCYFVSVKDKTSRKIDISQYANDLSIKGEFIRTVYAKAELNNEEKMTIINCGLKALDGKEIEL